MNPKEDLRVKAQIRTGRIIERLQTTNKSLSTTVVNLNDTIRQKDREIKELRLKLKEYNGLQLQLVPEPS